MSAQVVSALTVNQIVREACDEHPDPQEAVASILRRLRESDMEQELWNTETAKTLVSTLVGRSRHAARTVAASASWLNKAAAEQLEAPRQRSMLDTYMVGALRLGDCTRAELQEECVRAGAAMRGLRVKSSFLDAVASKLRGAATVRSKFNDRTIAELWRSVEGDTQ